MGSKSVVGVGTESYPENWLDCDDPNFEQKKRFLVQLHAGKTFSGLDGEDLSECMQLSHAVILNDIERQRKEGKDVIPVTVATIPQIRMSRKLVGEYVISETPFRCLYNEKVKNLIVAGCNVSVDTLMWDIMRDIPCCADRTKCWYCGGYD